MRTGLLICDHVPDRFRPIAGGYEDMFPALFTGLQLQPYYVCDGQLPDAVDACDAYLCTGSKYSVYDDIDWIHRLQDFVRQLHCHRKPFLGVCFGHQLMAEALGGKVERAPVGWSIGAHSFKVTQAEPWMRPCAPAFNVLMLCQDQVQRLPDNSTVLAYAPDCPVGMFRVGDTMLGIQAHPEFIADYNRAIIQDRVERIGAQKVKNGLASFGLPLHRQMLADWMTAFLRQALAARGASAAPAPKHSTGSAVLSERSIMKNEYRYEVVLNEGSHRFQVNDLGNREAFMDFRREEGILVLLHTKVPLAYQGRGVGRAMVRHAMEYAVAENLKVVALCPYSKAWLGRHPEYDDMVLPLDALRK